MEILTDDLAIFKILSEAEMENFDPRKKHVITFLSGNDWCLFLFNPSGELKGCRLYMLEQQTLDRELREKLLPDLLLLNDNHGYIILKNEALIVVESLISSRKENLFFDAH